MASFAKQMRDVAQAWLAANPDPAQSLCVPLDGRMKDRHAKQAREWAYLEKARAQLQGTGNEVLGKLESVLDRVEEAEDDLEGAYTQLSTIVSAEPFPGWLKYKAPEIRVDLGRWLLAWARHGYNTFELPQDFVAAMLLTDPEEAQLSSIRLPFQGILMLIPSGFAQGGEGLPYTKIHVCEVHEASSWLCVQATDGVRVIGFTIELAKLTWAAIETLSEEADSIFEQQAIAEADAMVRHTIQRVVLGMLAYMSLVKDAATLREVPHKQKAKRSSTSGEEITHWEIGRTVKIDSRLVQSARAGCREAAIHIEKRFIVRGHYRNQAHGPGRRERTRIYIEPFWKGPEEGARIVHTYKPQLEEDPPE